MDAIITAGGIPKPDDNLYPYAMGELKAVIDVAGKPMIQWVLDAVNSVENIENIVVVGIEDTDRVSCAKPMFFVTNHRSMLENIRAGVKAVVEINPRAEYVMLISSDIPAITSEMIDWMVESAVGIDADIFYLAIPRKVMESRFPGSNRSYIRFKDLEICGGDIIIFRAEVAAGRDKIWNRLIAARKNAFKQASLIGYDTLLMLLLRRLTLDEAVRTIAKRLDLKGKVLISPYAEIGMDVDKPNQLKLLKADLKKRMEYET